MAAVLASALLSGTSSAGASPAGGLGPGLPATVENIAVTKQMLAYPVLDATGADIGLTTWRVVRGTGNCCENHLGVTKTGRLFDFGGAYLYFSDDQGLTWKRVRPIEPLLGPEGTVVTAPNGDVLGVTWDPYTGDRVLAFKYEAATNQWQYMYEVLHTPVYDREWIAVVPGPHTIAGQTVPYLTVLRGGFPAKDLWYYSLDGLHYTLASNKVLTSIVGGSSARWFSSTADPEADWTQPISTSGLAPLGGGGAIAYGVDRLDGIAAQVLGSSWWVLEPSSLTWKSHRLGDGTPMPPGRLVQDSRGWVHLIDARESTVTYRLSQDGGRTWQVTETALPAGHIVEDWDLRANGQLGITVVAVHTHNDLSGFDQDLVLKYGTACGAPELTRTYFVGKGDLNAGKGVGADIRFDFATTVILPDGRIATSLLDAAHRTPNLAVEVSTTFTDPAYEPPPLSCGAPGG